MTTWTKWETQNWKMGSHHHLLGWRYQNFCPYPSRKHTALAFDSAAHSHKQQHMFVGQPLLQSLGWVWEAEAAQAVIRCGWMWEGVKSLQEIAIFWGNCSISFPYHLLKRVNNLYVRVDELLLDLLVAFALGRRPQGSIIVLLLCWPYNRWF